MTQMSRSGALGAKTDDHGKGKALHMGNDIVARGSGRYPKDASLEGASNFEFR
jgi:hypothetical protein